MAVDYRYGDGSAIGGSPVNQVDAVAKMRPGMIVRGYDFSTAGYGEGEFRYVKFTAAVVAGDCVIIDNAAFVGVQGSTTSTPANGQIGIAMASHPNAATTNDFGFVMVRGIHDGANVLTGVVAGAVLYLSAVTAGRFTNVVTATKKVDSALERLITSAANVGTVEINWPSAAGNG